MSRHSLARHAAITHNGMSARRILCVQSVKNHGVYPLLTALLSDIHANLEALSACLGDARERGAERFVFLGDLVGYGADARGVVELVARYADEGAVVLKGNHDEAIEEGGGYFNDAAQASLQWARETLSQEQKNFLASLPLIVRHESVCFVHASAAAPQRWDYIDSPAAAKLCADAAGACYTFCGHVHDQLLYFHNAHGRMTEFRPFPGTAIPAPSHRRWVAIVGSVGQPRDGNPGSRVYAVRSCRTKAYFFSCSLRCNGGR